MSLKEIAENFVVDFAASSDLDIAGYVKCFRDALASRATTQAPEQPVHLTEPSVERPEAVDVEQRAPLTARLMKFYGVTTMQELVEAQSHHVDRLQAKLPATPSLAPTFPRG